ncbi:MAG: hypothetical protein A3I17_04865 [Candidatus Rokubacteria bacterium RIFCSPLOWO2_02_FULL_72_37]|nr:MAG: hypothetical protein A3I17_04865 [Candidatus Rokubacteria bacterium RIFCSPLOWO2_02_FULL_72_37]
MARGVRVDAVGLVEPGIGGHPLEQEGHEGDRLAARDLREHAGERPGELEAVVRRHAHAGQQHAGARPAQAQDDALEVVARRSRVLAAQPVVRAERDDDDLGRGTEHPVQPAQSPGRRVPADPRVDDAVVETLAAEAHLEARGIRLLRADAEPGGEAVAERHDRARGARRRRRHEHGEDGAEERAHGQAAHDASVVWAS